MLRWTVELHEAISVMLWVVGPAILLKLLQLSNVVPVFQAPWLNAIIYIVLAAFIWFVADKMTREAVSGEYHRILQKGATNALADEIAEEMMAGRNDRQSISGVSPVWC